MERIRRERAPEGQAGHRSVVVLRVEPEALDRFFNSASGYRAQYLVQPELGNKANCIVIGKLLPKVLRALDRRSKQAERAFVESSLSHPWSKVWIHQGLWLRRAKREHRVLLVQAWQAEITSRDHRRRKLARWGALAPAHEIHLLVKGGYLCRGDELDVGKPPSMRARELHELGFT
ncbi:MAG: hypothetical protein ACE5NW_04040 [Acidiferrobacterales bacterium]